MSNVCNRKTAEEGVSQDVQNVLFSYDDWKIGN